MTELWRAPDDPTQFRKLLVVLGAAQHRRTVFVPEAIEATILNAPSGPEPRSSDDLARLPTFLTKALTPSVERGLARRRKRRRAVRSISGWKRIGPLEAGRFVCD